MTGYEAEYVQNVPGLCSESTLWENRHDPGARAELVRRYLPLATSVVIGRHSGTGMPEDAYSRAAELLSRAMEQFDPRSDPPFVEFAPRVIEAEIKRSPGGADGG